MDGFIKFLLFIIRKIYILVLYIGGITLMHAIIKSNDYHSQTYQF